MIKKITIEDLAIMVQKGFNDIIEQMTTKKELQDLKGEMNTRFDILENRQNIHYDKVENLEQRIKIAEESLEI